jgi:uncharacterized protein YihD (DUF1040 family)
MRDIKRIRKICNMLASAWEMVPDLRLSQLMFNVESEVGPLFYIEDEELILYIKDYCQKYSTLHKGNKDSESKTGES